MGASLGVCRELCPPTSQEDEREALRKLTPEQEGANARAEAHIREVAARIEQVARAERRAAADGSGPFWNQHNGHVIAEALDHTPLIDLEYIVELGRRGGVLPAGLQRVPHAALITSGNLWRIKLWSKEREKLSLGVLVFSYPWLDWFHPDRCGEQLRRLLPFLEAMLAEAKHDSPHCTVGVMIDFLCLPQKPFASDEEKRRFKHSLDNINTWYFHESTYVLLVSTAAPEGVAYGNTRLHQERGWCVFEKSAAMVIKNSDCLLDWAGYRGATRFDDDDGDVSQEGSCQGQMKQGRTPPVSPAVFGDRLRSGVASGALKFTAPADLEHVIGQYEMGFIASINRIAAREGYCFDRALYFTNLGWGEPEAEDLLQALEFAAARCSFPRGLVLVLCTGNEDAFQRKLQAEWQRRGLEGKFDKL